MFYIFNKSGENIATSSEEPNFDDLATRNEVAIESQKKLGDSDDVFLKNGEIILRPSIYSKWNGEKWVIDDKLKTQALANAKQDGVAQIDDLVGNIYLKFTRFDKEYQRREDQAKAFKANGYKGEVPLQVNAFASNVGISPQQATDIILAQAEKLNHALDILGELRMKKYQINQQETIEDVQKVTKQLIDEIQKVGGQL